MIGRWSLAAGLMILGTLAGCKSTATPDLAHPGRGEIQRKRAIRYDPYPETRLGTDMSDARPREYEAPPAEPSQSRWHLDPVTNSTRWGTQGRE
jgi:hypothetical protein